MLALVLVFEFVLFSSLSPYFLNVDTLSDATFQLHRACDGRVAAGAAHHRRARSTSRWRPSSRWRRLPWGWRRSRASGHRGSPRSASAPGSLAGCINGALVTFGRVPSIVATIGTMTLFRGIAYAVLGDRVLKDYPESFAAFGQGYVAGPISIELALFAVFAVSVRACSCIARAGAGPSSPIGANPVASRFAGIRGGPLSLRAVRAHGPGQRSGRGAAYFAARFDSSFDRAGLGTRDHQHGDPRRRVGLGRQGQYPRRGAGRAGVRPGDIRSRTHEHSRHRHVDLHRSAC